MKADSTSLLDLISIPNTIFDIPVYQRKYEWSQTQCEQLFSDLESLIEKQNNTHFLGTIVYIAEQNIDGSYTKQVIDGQQRLTSCILLLKAISSLSDDLNLKNKIEDQYLMNKYVSENNHYKLHSVESDYDNYLKIMNGSLSEEEFPSKMNLNYRYFLTRIENSNISTNEYLDALSRMSMIFIELENKNSGENPQVIFESINSTGISLLPADLIRNFLLMGVDSSEQIELYEEYWSKIQTKFTNDVITEFIRHYLICKTGKLTNKKDVYETYKYFFKSQKYNSRFALKELYEFSIFYKDLRDVNFENKVVRKSIHNINAMERRAIYPYLLKLLKLRNQGKIDESQFGSICNVLDSYLYRTLICRAGSPINGVVTTLIKSDSDEQELATVERILLNKNFPKNTDFIDSLQKIDIHKKRNNLAKITLSMLEGNLTGKEIDIEEIQIEKILPERPNNEWNISIKDVDLVNEKLGNTLGNLTLTMDNIELEECDYKKKKAEYLKSDFLITRMISHGFSEWDRVSIEKRSRNLSEEAVKVWRIPDANNYVVKQDVSGEHYLDEELIVRGQKPTKLIINEKSYNVSSWKALLIKMLDYIWDYNSEDFELLKMDNSMNEMLFKSEDAIRSPATLSNGEVIETNFSAHTILALIRKISEIFDMTDAISYKLQ